MSEASPQTSNLSAKRVLWWAILAGFGFKLGGEIAGAPFEVAIIWLRTQAGVG